MLRFLGDIAAGNMHLRDAFHALAEHFARHANRRTGAIVLLGILGLLLVYFELLMAPSQFPVGELVTVESGVPLVTIAESLEEQGVIRSAVAFRAVARLQGIETSVRAGDYLFKRNENMLEVLDRVVRGIHGLDPVAVRIPEGITIKRMADIYDRYMLRFDKETFIKEAEGLEGFLFPDTYYLLPNTTETQIIAAMKDNFESHWAELDQEALAQSAYSKAELVTLASIVELEAYNLEDRRKIAGVLYNRLDINMPLQVDVSFVYLLGKGTYQLSLKDLKYDSPYNTYVYKGLPPGPIGAPSMSSLKAVVDPVESNWLFYLADRRGVTYFSATYEEHLRKKRLYID